MAGFDAAQVSKLEWTFKPHVDASGVIPEPSDKLIDEFWHALQDVTETSDNDEAVKILSDADERISSKTAEIFGTVCQQSPSVEQILDLPYRVRQVFYGWVIGAITNPE